MKFSTGVPNCREGRLNPIGSVDPAWMSDVGTARLLLSLAERAEPNVRVRFDDPPNYYDALTTLGYLAAQTRQIRFLPSVLVLPLHHPILLNRQAATLDVLWGGRLTLGVGLGGSREGYRRLRGELGAVNRGQMMDEFVQALRALWTEEKASFSGRFVDFRDVHCFPKPRQDPLPLFMAGEADAVLRRIGRFAQGWIDSFSPPDSMRQIIGQLRHYTREARGTDAPIEIARQFYISLAETREAAQANLAASLPNAKPVPATRRREGAEAMLIGTPAEIAARLRDYGAAGVTEICPIFYSPDAAGALRQMELFAREVIPAVT